MIFAFESWFDTFFGAAEDFGQSYVYFIYPESEQDLTMNYMFDPMTVRDMYADRCLRFTGAMASQRRQAPWNCGAHRFLLKKSGSWREGHPFGTDI